MTSNEPERAMPKGVQSVETAYRLLSCLGQAGRPMPLSELAAGAEVSASMARNYLVSLIRTGQVRQQPSTGYYELGPSTLQLGLTAMGSIDAVAYCVDEIPRVQQETPETLFLSVWGNRGPAIIRWYEGRRPVTVELRTGSVLRMLTTATGRAFLAYLPASRTAPFVDAEQAEAELIGKCYDVEALRAQVLRHGIAKADSELLPGISALAAPVFDAEQRLQVVLSAIGRRTFFDASLGGETSTVLRSVAERITDQLGGRPPQP